MGLHLRLGQIVGGLVKRVVTLRLYPKIKEKPLKSQTEQTSKNTAIEVEKSHFGEK